MRSTTHHSASRGSGENHAAREARNTQNTAAWLIMLALIAAGCGPTRKPVPNPPNSLIGMTRHSFVHAGKSPLAILPAVLKMKWKGDSVGLYTIEEYNDLETQYQDALDAVAKKKVGIIDFPPSEVLIFDNPHAAIWQLPTDDQPFTLLVFDQWPACDLDAVVDRIAAKKDLPKSKADPVKWTLPNNAFYIIAARDSILYDTTIAEKIELQAGVYEIAAERYDSPDEGLDIHVFRFNLKSKLEATEDDDPGDAPGLSGQTGTPSGQPNSNAGGSASPSKETSQDSSTGPKKNTKKQSSGSEGQEADSTVPAIDCEVISVKSTADEAFVVELSAGRDDGLQSGQMLELYRKKAGTFHSLGRVKVKNAQPDRATAIVVHQEEGSTIQAQDRATTVLQALRLANPLVLSPAVSNTGNPENKSE